MSRKDSATFGTLRPLAHTSDGASSELTLVWEPAGRFSFISEHELQFSVKSRVWRYRFIYDGWGSPFDMSSDDWKLAKDLFANSFRNERALAHAIEQLGINSKSTLVDVSPKWASDTKTVLVITLVIFEEKIVNVNAFVKATNKRFNGWINDVYHPIHTCSIRE